MAECGGGIRCTEYVRRLRFANVEPCKECHHGREDCDNHCGRRVTIGLGMVVVVPLQIEDSVKHGPAELLCTAVNLQNQITKNICEFAKI